MLSEKELIAEADAVDGLYGAYMINSWLHRDIDRRCLVARVSEGCLSWQTMRDLGQRIGTHLVDVSYRASNPHYSDLTPGDVEEVRLIAWWGI